MPASGSSKKILSASAAALDASSASRRVHPIASQTPSPASPDWFTVKSAASTFDAASRAKLATTASTPMRLHPRDRTAPKHIPLSTDLPTIRARPTQVKRVRDAVHSRLAHKEVDARSVRFVVAVRNSDAARVSNVSTAPANLAPYLPRLVRGWSDEPADLRAREIDGTLVSIDISGFTALAELLAINGKAGAEELVGHISAVFDALIGVAERHGGDVLKFRGDALLLLVAGERHAERAAGAASDMQWTIEEIGSAESSVGPVELRMSVGVHSGTCHFFLTTVPHRELLVAGPAATRVFELEDLANAGEIMVSAETAAQIDPSWLGGDRDGARLMRRLAPGASTIPPPPEVPGVGLENYVPRPLRDHLAVASGEAEHRQVTVAFLKLSGTDAAIEDGTMLGMLDELAAAVAAACDTYGLTWLESDIDVGAVKLYLTGGAPSSSGDDEEGMVRALRDVIAACPELPLRAGVNRGHVFTGDIGNPHRRTYAVMGDAVNLAARLTARAGPRRILATSNVLDRARTLYATVTEPMLVKGKEQAVMAHAVGDVIGQRPKQSPDLTPIVGRDAEIERLQIAVNAARTRQLRIIELVGEPGIGKSRLVQELRTLAIGFQQLDTAGEQYSTKEPFAAVRPVLRQLVGITSDSSAAEAGTLLQTFVAGVMPDLVPWLPLLAIPFDADVTMTPESSVLDPAASRDKLHWAVETFLERVLMMPTLLVIEDGHWLDDASRFLLTSLLATPAMRPWLVCVTTRPARTDRRDSRARGADRAAATRWPCGRGARARGRIAVRTLRRRDRGGRRALRWQSPVRPRARLRSGARHFRRRAPGDRREPSHYADRHTRSGRPHAPALRIGRRAVVRARPHR